MMAIQWIICFLFQRRLVLRKKEATKHSLFHNNRIIMNVWIVNVFSKRLQGKVIKWNVNDNSVYVDYIVKVNQLRRLQSNNMFYLEMKHFKCFTFTFDVLFLVRLEIGVEKISGKMFISFVMINVSFHLMAVFTSKLLLY